jgi:nucleoid-associated protein YgaU
MLTEKYQPVLDLGKKLEMKLENVKEEGGKLKINAVASYQLDKDLFWDAIKSVPLWEKEVAADIKVANKDIFGVYTVKPGDTLSKIAQKYLQTPTRYTDIFNLNKDILKNPDNIDVGQKLKIPNV